MVSACLLVYNLLSLMVTVTAASGDDNSSTIIIIIAVTAAIVVIGIVVVIVIGCLCYSKTVKRIKARVKKQIINNAEKRNIYRPGDISIDDFFRAYDLEEQRTFFPNDKKSKTCEKLETIKETMPGNFEDDIEKVIEDKGEHQVKQIPESDGNIYIAGLDDKFCGEKTQKDLLNYHVDDNENNDDENIESIPIENIILPSTDRKQKVFKLKLRSQGFMTVDRNSVTPHQKRNNERWKLLSLNRKTKNEYNKETKKSSSIRHKVFGYFRKSFGTKVSKIHIRNKKLKMYKSKNTKRKTRNRFLNNMLDNETQETPEYVSYTNPVENGTAYLLTPDHGQEACDMDYTHLPESNTTSEMNERRSLKDVRKYLKRRKNTSSTNDERMEITKKIYLDTSDIQKIKSAKLRVEKTLKRKRPKTTDVTSKKIVPNENAGCVDDDFVLDIEPVRLSNGQFDGYNSQDETESRCVHINEYSTEQKIDNTTGALQESTIADIFKAGQHDETDPDILKVGEHDKTGPGMFKVDGHDEKDPDIFKVDEHNETEPDMFKDCEHDKTVPDIFKAYGHDEKDPDMFKANAQDKTDSYMFKADEQDKTDSNMFKADGQDKTDPDMFKADGQDKTDSNMLKADEQDKTDSYMFQANEEDKTDSNMFKADGQDKTDSYMFKADGHEKTESNMFKANEQDKTDSNMFKADWQDMTDSDMFKADGRFETDPGMFKDDGHDEKVKMN